MTVKPYTISEPIKLDLRKIEAELSRAVADAGGRLSLAADSLLKAGGKRLRPALVLISGLTGDYELTRLMDGAVAVELVHTASLVHDDIVDGALVRRGMPTVEAVCGPRTAIAAGDYLFASAFELLAGLDQPRVIDAMAEAAVDLSSGELLAMETARDFSSGLDTYLERIRRKTASLFSACCRIGAILTGATESAVESLALYGENLGMAFQICDDLLDLIGGRELGKRAGIDIREGAITMPVLFALEESPDRDELRSIIEKEVADEAGIERARHLIAATKALRRTKAEAQAYAGRALEALANLRPPAAVRDLASIASFAVERRF